MPVGKILEFIWSVSSSSVSFVVRQNPWHVLHEKYYSRAQKPPIEDVVDYMRKINKSEKEIDERIKYHIQWKKNTEKEQEKLDALFSKYKIKTGKKTTKPPTKPVKKM